MSVPEIRLRACNDAKVDARGRYVLYWMNATRRSHDNFALDHAVDEATRLGVGVVVMEGVRCDYPWASDRFHAFILQGMAANLEAFKSQGIPYLPYVERSVGEGKGLLKALAREACLVVTDDYPTYFLPRMLEAAARQLDVPLVAVDSNGLLPMRACDRPMATAYAFRAFLQRELLPHLRHFPRPSQQAAPAASIDFPSPWKVVTAGELMHAETLMVTLPVDHTVGMVEQEGGTAVARQTLQDFLQSQLSRYAEERNDPDSGAESHLSPYLHFGYISTHQVLTAIMEREGADEVGGHKVRGGSKEGWWGLSRSAEAFIDQIVTWRELGFNHCAHVEDHDRYDALPAWARRTLDEHSYDQRTHQYSLEQFTRADTHDPVWNAAQNQLMEEGRIQNYLRMLWGKKILEWTASPREALEVMIELNNRYALDGRDPNSYTGILWILGLFDRPWAPERPIFGSIRYMSSASAQRKLNMEGYLYKYGQRV